MPDQNYVSVIILCYNGLQYMEGCLDSLLDQDYPRNMYEIIVADNGSTDNSFSFLKSKYHNEIILVGYGENHGFAKGNNLAIHYTKGDLLVFLNQDTIVGKTWLSGLVSGIVNHYDACHSNMLLPRNIEFKNMYNRKLPEKIYYYEINKYGYVEQIIKDYNNCVIETKFLSGASFIIKRSVLKEIGYLFDESLGSYNEDMDLGFRLVANGYKVGVVPSSVVYHLSRFSFKFNKYNVWKNLIISRNRFVVFWKALNYVNFLCFLPYLFISQSHKVYTRSIEIENSLFISTLLASSVLPLTIISFIWFVLSIPRIGLHTSKKNSRKCRSIVKS